MRLAVRVQIRLLGTADAAGWPTPGCACVSCRAAKLSGEVRAPLAAVIDGYVALTDGGVEPAPGYDVHPAGTAWTVIGPDGTRLLWAPHEGEVPDASPYHAVLLGLDDLTSWPLRLATLRRCGAVTAGTYVAGVDVGHHLPPTPELARVLQGWGAELPADGTMVEFPSLSRQVRPPRVLVIGGTRSGKSAYAEQRLAAEPDVTYVATAPPRPDDAEWTQRVQAHAARRPATWQTVETADVAELLATPNPVLVDDLGLWLTRLLDDHAGWEGTVPAAVEEASSRLVAAWSGRTAAAVLVAPEVGAGVVPATASGRRFSDLLGALTTRLAAESDELVQVVAGFPRWLR